MPDFTRTSPKLIHLETIGTLVGAADFQARMEMNRSSPRLLFKVRKNSGTEWSVAFIEGIGLAIASHQTHRLFLIDCRTFIDLACEAGIEDRAGLIVIPRGVAP